VSREKKRGSRRRWLLLGPLSAAGALLLLLIALAVIPTGERPLAYHPLPDMTYAETVAAVRQRIREAPANIRPECRGMMLEHGRPTGRVFVLMHGLTNCPAQFRRFGELLYRNGCNVVILRLPFHGEQDRLTDDVQKMTAQMMLDGANNAVDVARRLGRRVTVVGLSVNAVVGAWIAQNRSDVQEVVLLAPFLAPKGVTPELIAPLGRLLRRLPNQFLWWDGKKKAALGGTAYPRYPTHAIAQIMRMASEVLDAAGKRPPQCGSILVVTTASDAAANAELTARLVRLWDARAGGRLRTYEFPKEQEVGHDFIDPTQPYARVGLVYPKLLSLLGIIPPGSGRSAPAPHP
jgi:pimeloyl-ACP methyl ester carboxylesterase